MATKEDVVQGALRELFPFLGRRLNGQEVAMDLYGRGMLTFGEYESIRSQADPMKINTTLLSALQRRGEDALDELLGALREEVTANKSIISKIEEG